jgi:hypothetical protein
LFQEQKPSQQKCKLAHWHLNHANGVELKPPQKQFNNQTQKTREVSTNYCRNHLGKQTGTEAKKEIPIKLKQNGDQQRTTRKDSEANVVTQLDTKSKQRNVGIEIQARNCDSKFQTAKTDLANPTKLLPSTRQKKSSARNSPRKCKVRASCSRRERERERARLQECSTGLAASKQVKKTHESSDERKLGATEETEEATTKNEGRMCRAFYEGIR